MLKDLAKKEIKEMYRNVQYSHVVAQFGQYNETEVLSNVVLDSLVKRNISHIIHILHLVSNTNVLLSVTDKIASENKHIRSSAMELVENNVDAQVARLFLPLCEDTQPEKLITLAKSNWNFDTPDVYFVLGQLYQLSDKWIRALVLYVAMRLDRAEKKDRFTRALNVKEGAAHQTLTGLVYG